MVKRRGGVHLSQQEGACNSKGKAATQPKLRRAGLPVLLCPPSEIDGRGNEPLASAPCVPKRGLAVTHWTLWTGPKKKIVDGTHLDERTSNWAHRDCLSSHGRCRKNEIDPFTRARARASTMRSRTQNRHDGFARTDDPKHEWQRWGCWGPEGRERHRTVAVGQPHNGE